MRINQLKTGYGQLTPEKVRLIARLKFDGCICKTGHNYIMKYEVRDNDLLESFKKDVISVYGLTPKKMRNKSGKTGKPIWYYYFRSKLAYEDLMEYGPYSSRSWMIPAAIWASPDPLKKEFLRCFFDDEGSVFQLSKRKQWIVRGYSINKKGIMQIAEMLSSLGIESRLHSGFGMDRNVFGIELRDVKLFSATVGFLCERKRAKLENYLAAKMP